MYSIKKTGLGYFKNIVDNNQHIVAHVSKFSNGLWGIVDLNDKTIRRGVFKTPNRALKEYMNIIKDKQNEK